MIILQNRRHRFKPSYNNMDTLTIIKRVLQILIAILLIVFIFSSIRMKKSFSNQKLLADNIHNIESNDDNQINTSNENNIDIDSNIASENSQSNEQKNESKSTSINMTLLGDIMCPKQFVKMLIIPTQILMIFHIYLRILSIIFRLQIFLSVI